MTAHPLVQPGRAHLAFARSANGSTALGTAFAASPLRFFTPRNHGDAAWVYLASLGGGLVDGDALHVELDVGPGASALLGTQATTKVYRSPRGCSQRLVARVAEGASLALVPDPVVCFAGARYDQDVRVDLAPGASLVLLDGYTCGRSAYGERWAFERYASRVTITRGGARVAVDATRLEPAEGAIAERMGRFDVAFTLLAFGPRFAPVRDAVLAHASQGVASPADDGTAIASASPLGADGCILRVVAERFETGSSVLRTSFVALAGVLGDDPFARKW